MEPTGSPEKSVLNQPTLHNVPEDDRIEDIDKTTFLIRKLKLRDLLPQNHSHLLTFGFNDLCSFVFSYYKAA